MTSEGDLQTSQGQDPDHSQSLPHAHLQLPNLRDRDEQDEDIVDHVDHAKGKEEAADVDAALSSHACKLFPKVGRGLASRTHGCPNYDGVAGCQKAAYTQGDGEKAAGILLKYSVIETKN